MPSVLQVNVGLNPVVVWNGRAAPGVNTLLLWNSDTTNTVYVGDTSTISPTSPNTIPLPPNASISVDPGSPWWVVGAIAGIAPLVVLPNGQNFFLGLTQGLGNLAIPSIQSPNFVPGVSGWQIDQDGNAEFNSLTIIVQSDGVAILIYSPEAGAGTLIGWWAGSDGTDHYDNPYTAGIGVTQGVITGTTVSSATVIASVLTQISMSNSTITSTDIQGGTITETLITFDTNGGELFVYSTETTTVTQIYTRRLHYYLSGRHYRSRRSLYRRRRRRYRRYRFCRPGRWRRRRLCRRTKLPCSR